VVELCGDPRQARGLAQNTTLELSALESQHLTDLIAWNSLCVESEDLAQGEAKILEDEHAIELLDLCRSVVAVPGRVFDTVGAQHPDDVVVAKRLDGDLNDP
jgi:hypothetical protein